MGFWRTFNSILPTPVTPVDSCPFWLEVTGCQEYCGIKEWKIEIEQPKNATKPTVRILIQLFFLNNVPWTAAGLCLTLWILIKLVLTSFAFVLVAFMDEVIFEGPYSTIFTDVSLACYFTLSFNTAVDYVNLNIRNLSKFGVRTFSEKAKANEYPHTSTVYFPIKLFEVYHPTLYHLTVHCAINLIGQHAILRMKA